MTQRLWLDRTLAHTSVKQVSYLLYRRQVWRFRWPFHNIHAVLQGFYTLDSVLSESRPTMTVAYTDLKIIQSFVFISLLVQKLQQKILLRWQFGLVCIGPLLTRQDSDTDLSRMPAGLSLVIEVVVAFMVREGWGI